MFSLRNNLLIKIREGELAFWQALVVGWLVGLDNVPMCEGKKNKNVRWDKNLNSQEGLSVG